MIDVAGKLILFWTHRCGSTSGQLWFFQLAGWGDRIGKGVGASKLAAQWYAEHPDVYADRQRFYRDPSFKKVAIVRDPMSRAVSAYSVVIDTASGAQWRGVASALVDPDAERRITFLEFLEYLEATDLHTTNLHWRLQTAQDWYEQRLEGVQIVRVETLSQDLQRIAAELGRTVAVKRSSATTKLETDLGGLDVCRMTRADFAERFGRDDRGRIRFPDYRHFINADTAPRIARLYRQDFEVLGYPVALPPH